MIYVFVSLTVKPVPIETAVRFNFSAMRYAPRKLKEGEVTLSRKEGTEAVS